MHQFRVYAIHQVVKTERRPLVKKKGVNTCTTHDQLHKDVIKNRENDILTRKNVKVFNRFLFFLTFLKKKKKLMRRDQNDDRFDLFDGGSRSHNETSYTISYS